MSVNHMGFQNESGFCGHTQKSSIGVTNEVMRICICESAHTDYRIGQKTPQANGCVVDFKGIFKINSGKIFSPPFRHTCLCE